MTMRRVVVVGGSIAAVTAIDALRLHGYEGSIVMVSAERHAPYSRVPLSKDVLSGASSAETAQLPALDDSVDLILGDRATTLDTTSRTVELASGARVPFDGLVVATGARPIRLAEDGQTGELVLRDLPDAMVIAERASHATSAIVVGGGFLGMEVASTLLDLGLAVTLVDREPPLRRLLGPWMASLVTTAAVAKGLRVVHGSGNVQLIGDPVDGVRLGDGQTLRADLVVSAVGDRPAAEWLASSGLPVRGGVVVDEQCRVAPGVVAAGDVAVVQRPAGLLTRSPHWTNAVEQGRVAAISLIDADNAVEARPDPYYWTEQFGLNIKIVGNLPGLGSPEILDGDVESRSALLQWGNSCEPVATIAAINYRIAVGRLKKLRAVGDGT
jgi:3-phenylpropionate/trans-cinnamate dioxygenase ferredoxin reductase component